MVISKRKIIDYLLIIFVIAISGMPYFTSTIFLIPLFVFSLLIFLFRRISLDISFIYFLFLIAIITIVQTIVFKFYSFQTVLGVFLRIINAYLVVKILKTNFTIYYTKVIYHLAILSLVIYIPVIFFSDVFYYLMKLVPFFQIFNFTDSPHETILISNLNGHLLHFNRNSGPFWEPGAFGGYLMLAFMFNAFYKHDQQKKIGFVLLLAIFSTISTTVVLALFVFLFFMLQKSNVIFRVFSPIVVVLISYYSYTTFDFIGEKIRHQISDVRMDMDPYRETKNTQRFLNILRDIRDFRGHEIVGRGSNPQTRYSYDPENQIRTVGLTDIIVRMGIPVFILMMVMLYSSMKSVIGYFGIDENLLVFGSVLVILILTMSETYFNFIIFWCLIFLKFVYSSPNSIYSTK